MADMPHCECDHEGAIADPSMLSWYDPVTERPYIEHPPGKCRCTNNLRPYKRDGKIVMLCSICVMFDEPAVAQ